MSGAGEVGLKGMGQPILWNTPGLLWGNPLLHWNGLVPQTPSNNMTPDNRISATMSAQDVTDVLAAIQVIRTKMPWLISISNEERQQIPKLGDKTVGFDEKCAMYMASNPEFLPGFIDIAEVNKDRNLRSPLMQVQPHLSTLAESFGDTLLVTSSEIYLADLAYYANVREAAKRGRPGADTIFNDLKVRFPGANPQPPTPPGP